MWGIEARNAAIANSYFTCAINRVGTVSYVFEVNFHCINIAWEQFGPKSSRTSSCLGGTEAVLTLSTLTPPLKCTYG